MTPAGFEFGLALIVAGVVLEAPEVVLVGMLVLLALGVTGLWPRFGLRQLHYERKIGRGRTVWGEDLPLDIAVWNDKPLPVPMVSVEDFASAGAVVREVHLEPSRKPGLAILRSRWALGWHERVVRHLTIAAVQRGAYSFGSIRITVADLFGYGEATEEYEDETTYVVQPRTLPVRLAKQPRVLEGDLRSRHGLFEDPALFAGVRPYRSSDPLRRVHWRATARTGLVVSKRFDPSREQTILLALDVQTSSGAIWTNDEELVESLMVATSSLARHAILGGASCGLAAMALSRTVDAFALARPRTGRDQLSAIVELLGRLHPAPAAPFEHLLARLPRRVAPGTTIVVVTARDPEPYVEALSRLHRLGYPIQVIGLGPNSHHAVKRARARGFTAMTGSLTPDWRTSDALVLAS